MTEQTDDAREPLTDLPRRRATHGTDERDRQQVNNHGDVDVVRTPEGNYPVQLPLEPGAVVTLDGDEMTFAGFHRDGLKFAEGIAEGVHSFNTRVRNATEIEVAYPDA